MESLAALIAGVPWPHLAALATASWILALVCFVGYHRPRRRSPAFQPRLELIPRHEDDRDSQEGELAA